MGGQNWDQEMGRKQRQSPPRFQNPETASGCRSNFIVQYRNLYATFQPIRVQLCNQTPTRMEGVYTRCPVKANWLVLTM